MEADLETLRKRLIYRATHRGTRELDLMIGGFALAKVGNFNLSQCATFENLLQLPETDLAAWLLRQEPVPPEHHSQIMTDLMAFTLSAEA